MKDKTDKANLTVAELENKLNLSYELGQVTIIETLAKRFKNKSGELFANDKDQQAAWLKSLANDLEREAEGMRKDYTKKRDGK